MAQTTLTHLGFIADGNRRWAKNHGLPTLEGHRRGLDKVKLIAEQFKDTEVKYLSFFLFSTENWNRSQEEVDYLMKLAGQMVDKLASELADENLRCILVGRPEHVDPALWEKIQNAVARTQNNTGMTVCVCFNYGGHWEIVDAAKQASAAQEQDWSPESFRKYLYHPEVPDCDLIVRTSGERRFSGFQLWRAAYSEFMFIDKLFPDVEVEDCQKIIDYFYQRERRFGK